MVVAASQWTVYPPLSSLGQDKNSIPYDSLTFETITDTKTVYTAVKLNSSKQWKFTFQVWIMIIFVTMVYGPIAAFLVEMFPTNQVHEYEFTLPYW